MSPVGPNDELRLLWRLYRRASESHSPAQSVHCITLDEIQENKAHHTNHLANQPSR